MKPSNLRVAIVDYGMGNLFSVKHAFEHIGVEAIITSSQEDITAADGIILPGVGAFGDAMESLRSLKLVDLLKGLVSDGKPLIGICLGLQLLMSESTEFGHHKGLGLIEGTVTRFENPEATLGNQIRQLKVPQIGWNNICQTPDQTWDNTPFEGLQSGELMYFVHSYYVQPTTTEHVLSTTNYGHSEFCSSVYFNNVFACQFHPERSGKHGLTIYRNISHFLQAAREQQHD